MNVSSVSGLLLRGVVSWVTTGMSNDEIAAQLTISTDTVRTHVGRALLKLQARDRAQLVVFAMLSGLGPPVPRAFELRSTGVF